MQALKGNVKIAYYPGPDEDQFLFRPALGLDVRSRRQLLEKLMEFEREGLGGVLMSEVKEALHNPEKAVKVSWFGNWFLGAWLRVTNDLESLLISLIPRFSPTFVLQSKVEAWE